LTAVIEAHNLARWYGRVVALTDLTVALPPGITGLLGPNGAGKSTFLRLLTGQLYPSSGAVRILGRNPIHHPEVFHEIGFCSEDDALFDDMTARQAVSFLARCTGYSSADARRRAADALDRCGMSHALDRRCRGFSKGMRQRTRMAAALVHEPKLLLLDEPMTGLDPVGRRDVVDIVRSFAEEGGSVVFSSHILHEVEAVAQHVAIVNKGMLLAEGTLSEIQEELSDYAFVLEVRCSEPRRLARELSSRGHVAGLKFSGPDHLSITSESARTLTEELPSLALATGIEIHELTCPGDNLEALFQRLVK